MLYFSFDGQFLVAWLLKQGTAPEIIPNGSKIMTINLSCLGIRVIDSYNFLPMALSKLPSCFGIEELKKGFFPHLFYVQENQNYIGPLPEKKYFNPDSMTSTNGTEFLVWYEKHKNDSFNFQSEMLAYCR